MLKRWLLMEVARKLCLGNRARTWYPQRNLQDYTFWLQLKCTILLIYLFTGSLTKKTLHFHTYLSCIVFIPPPSLSLLLIWPPKKKKKIALPSVSMTHVSHYPLLFHSSLPWGFAFSTHSHLSICMPPIYN